MAVSASVTVFGRSEVGLVRKNNEDALLVSNLTGASIESFPAPMVLEEHSRGVLLAVSDGMGGRKAGDTASSMALASLQRGLTSVDAPTPEDALVACVEAANREVWEASKIEWLQGMGATLTAVLVYRGFAYIAEIGDSRAYLLRGDRIFRLTHDQSVAQLMLDQGKITPAELEFCEFKHTILQAVGTRPTVTVALGRLTLRRGDRLLLCSDGLSGKVHDEEIAQIVAGSRTIQGACNQLVDLALFRGGDDNITVLIGEHDGANLPEVLDPARISLASIQSFLASCELPEQQGA